MEVRDSRPDINVHQGNPDYLDRGFKQKCSLIVDDKNKQIARIPSKFLNSFGCINYDHYGNVPWTNAEISEISLSKKYKNITNFLGIGYEMFEDGVDIQKVKRVSIVNEYGYCIYDTFVNQYSRIRTEDVATAPTIKVVRQKVAELVQGKTLVGHFIQNELRVLKLQCHSDIRNTANYFQQLNTSNQIPSLKELTEEYLCTSIQSGEHSSIEDAQAAIKLHSVCRDKWEQFIQSNTDQKDKKEKTELPCGHKHTASSGTNLNQFKCGTSVMKCLPCGHLQNAPCHYSSLNLKCEICSPEKHGKHSIERTITLNCGSLLNDKSNTVLKKCDIKTSKKLSCGHFQHVPCSKPISVVKCKSLKLMQLPCGHDLKVACRSDIIKVKCQWKVKKYRPCGHDEVVKCSQNISKKCLKKVTKPLPCEHATAKMQCHQSATYQCVQNKNVVLDCGHEQKVPCITHITSNVVCLTNVFKTFPCGHEIKVECYRDISKMMCSQKVMKKLPCGHERKVGCGKNISNPMCVEEIMKTMSCGHQKKSQCHKLNVKCDICGQKRQALSESQSPNCPNPSNSSIKLPCGHLHAMLPNQRNTINVQIGDSNKIECRVVITKNLLCGHVVTIECRKLEKYHCRIMKKIFLTCGHVHMVPCDTKESKIKCIVIVVKDLPCGHQQKSPCHQTFRIKCNECAANNSENSTP